MREFRKVEVVIPRRRKYIKEEYSDFFEQDEDERAAPTPPVVGDKLTSQVSSLHDAKPPKAPKKESLDSKHTVKREERDNNQALTDAKPLDVKDFLNPNIALKKTGKKKQKEMELLLQTVLARVKELKLQPLPLPNLDADFLNDTFSREFFPTAFGGSKMLGFAEVSTNYLRLHGMNNFLFLNDKMNPYAPQRPGFPGIFFECFLRHLGKLPLANPFRIFSKLGDGQWLYVGTYELIATNPLTSQEWRELPDDTKEAWCTGIRDKIYGKALCQRIMSARPAGQQAAVTIDEIQEVYNKGQEHMEAWAMKCVSYDQDLQRQIIDLQKRWKIDRKAFAEEMKEKCAAAMRGLEIEEEKKWQAGVEVKKEEDKGKVKLEPKHEEVELKPRKSSKVKVKKEESDNEPEQKENRRTTTALRKRSILVETKNETDGTGKVPRGRRTVEGGGTKRSRKRDSVKVESECRRVKARRL